MTIRNDRATQTPLQKSNAAKTISTNHGLEAHCDELAFRVRRLLDTQQLLDSIFPTQYVSRAMFEPIREKIETASQKTTQLRRFL